MESHKSATIEEIISVIDWKKIFYKIVVIYSKLFKCNMITDTNILDEVEARALKSLILLGVATPNKSKIAGCMSFWIRKLKPISYLEDNKQKFLAINELVALHMGFAICCSETNRFEDSSSIKSPRIFHDLVQSLRGNVYSPESLTFIFEIICDNLPYTKN